MTTNNGKNGPSEDSRGDPDLSRLLRQEWHDGANHKQQSADAQEDADPGLWVWEEHGRVKRNAEACG